MTAQIIRFPHAPKPADAIDGEIVSEVPASAIPAGFDFTPAVANRFAHLTPQACNRKRKPRTAMRVERLAVTCKRTPAKHRDLHNQVGVLVIDWKGKLPYTVTFDPSDESIENIVAPVEGWNRGDDSIAVKSDEGTWVFVPLLDATVVER